jgi:hypothetical protein
MRRFLLLASFFASAASAKDCPVKFGDELFLDKVGAAIHATKTCGEAGELAQACALGASGDVATAVTAERKCGLDFWTKLTPDEKKHYNSLQAKCDAKYAGRDGTIYISAAAFCRLSVARFYSDLYTQPDD